MKPDMMVRTRCAATLPSLVALTSPVQAWAQQRPGYYYGHMWDGGWHGWFFGPFMMLLFVALVVVGILLLVRRTGARESASAAAGPSGSTPLDILKERFARGEIDKEEFEERRRVLEK